MEGYKSEVPPLQSYPEIFPYSSAAESFSNENAAALTGHLLHHLLAASLGVDWASLLFSLPKEEGNHIQDNEFLGQMPAARVEGNRRKAKREERESKFPKPRFSFQTRSPIEILDDGYRWRKYGQKTVKNSAHPRSYFRCSQHTCEVKKQVQRLATDASIVVTTYEGIHNHPCEKLMELLSPIIKQIQFLSGQRS